MSSVRPEGGSYKYFQYFFQNLVIGVVVVLNRQCHCCVLLRRMQLCHGEHCNFGAHQL